ncbi:MAG: TlpA family protein disulfide reductase [Marinifilaceae bacterium]
MKRLIFIITFLLVHPLCSLFAQQMRIPAVDNLPFRQTEQMKQLMDGYATYATQQQKRVWNEKPHPDYISAILQSYKSKADSIIKVVNGPDSFNNYMRIWALQEYYNTIAIVRDISINMFKIPVPRLKEWEDKYILSILDKPEALLFPNSPVYAIGVIRQRKFVLEKQVKTLEQKFKNIQVREFFIDALINGYIDTYNFNNGYETGLADITKATAQLPDSGKKYIDKFMSRRHKMKGASLPDITLERPDGSRIQLTELTGKPLYIDVWSSWCAPCREELMHLKKLEKTYTDTDIQFISISLDKNRDEWLAKIKEMKLDPSRQYFAVDDSLPVTMQIDAIPHFLIYNRQGKLEHYKAPRPSENNKLYQLLKELK